ncbi:MAG: B12-binding domain-containing radical SAM protein [Candidatus Desulfofervidaceae bacterium]|nr:B12-binding domain-containing radical SAM protein [Candidatus Desulfofervidaceae bacterium]
MKNIIFIEPKPENLHFFSRFKLPRLGTILLATILKKHGYKTKVYVEEIAPLNWADIKKADLVCISTITSTAIRAYYLARKVRQMGIPVAMGGPHVTFLAEEALRYADFVIRGEGEQSILELIEALEGKRPFSKVKGLSWQENKKIYHNETAPLTEDLNTLPYPNFSLIQGWQAVKGLVKKIIPIQTSRGCPFNCRFCSVTRMFGRKMRYRSVEHVIGELKQYNNPHYHVFFYDDNFIADPQKAKALLLAMKEKNFAFSWSTQVRVDIARYPQILSLAKDTNCDGFYIGFESVNPESLVEMNKKQSIEDIKKAIQVINKLNLHIHGMFIFGLDKDNLASIKNTVQFALKNKIGSVQFSILTPLPGTPVYQELKKKKRILSFDWSLYDGLHIVFRPCNFSPYILQKAMLNAHKTFYSLKNTLKRILESRYLATQISLYALKLSYEWEWKNKEFLKWLKELDFQGQSFTA